MNKQIKTDKQINTQCNKLKQQVYINKATLKRSRKLEKHLD